MAGFRPDMPIKRSVTIAGHETSISLEAMFWTGLREAARERGLPLNALIAEIDLARYEADPLSPPNLASAIRQWLYARSIAAIDEAKTAPSSGA